jgi:hypothetical protein
VLSTPVIWSKVGGQAQCRQWYLNEAFNCNGSQGRHSHYLHAPDQGAAQALGTHKTPSISCGVAIDKRGPTSSSVIRTTRMPFTWHVPTKTTSARIRQVVHSQSGKLNSTTLSMDDETAYTQLFASLHFMCTTHHLSSIDPSHQQCRCE